MMMTGSHLEAMIASGIRRSNGNIHTSPNRCFNTSVGGISSGGERFYNSFKLQAFLINLYSEY